MDSCISSARPEPPSQAPATGAALLSRPADAWGKASPGKSWPHIVPVSITLQCIHCYLITVLQTATFLVAQNCNDPHQDQLQVNIFLQMFHTRITCTKLQMLSRAIDVGLKCRFCRKNINTSNFLIRIYSVHFAVCSWNKDHHNQFQIMTMLSSRIITINFKLWKEVGPCQSVQSVQSMKIIITFICNSKIITINFKIWKEDNHDDHWKHGDQMIIRTKHYNDHKQTIYNL